MHPSWHRSATGIFNDGVDWHEKNLFNDSPAFLAAKLMIALRDKHAAASGFR
jgi:hypothetical protein